MSASFRHGGVGSVKVRLRLDRFGHSIRRMQEPSSSERIQRIRIGLTGLAFVFLLVLLGTAISRSGEEPSRGAAATN